MAFIVPGQSNQNSKVTSKATLKSNKGGFVIPTQSQTEIQMYRDRGAAAKKVIETQNKELPKKTETKPVDFGKKTQNTLDSMLKFAPKVNTTPNKTLPYVKTFKEVPKNLSSGNVLGGLGNAAKGTGQMLLEGLQGPQKLVLNASKGILDVAKGKKPSFNPNISTESYLKDTGSAKAQKFYNTTGGKIASGILGVVSDPLTWAGGGLASDAITAAEIGTKGVINATKTGEKVSTKLLDNPLARSLNDRLSTLSKNSTNANIAARESAITANKVEPRSNPLNDVLSQQNKSNVITPSLPKELPRSGNKNVAVNIDNGSSVLNVPIEKQGKKIVTELKSELPKVTDNIIPDTKQFISTKTKPKSSSNILQKAYTSTVDDLYAIGKVDKEAYTKAINTRQVDMIAHRSLTTGLVDKNGQVVGKSLKGITSKIPKGKELDFEDYLINRRASYWMENGKKVFPDSANMTPEKSRIKVAQYEATNPEFKQLGNDYTKYNQDLTKTWLVDSGMISPQSFDNMIKADPDYVPFQREFTDLEKGTGVFAKRGFVNQSIPIKKATGSQRKIISPIESTIEKTSQYIKTAKRNEVGQSILNEVRQNPEAYNGLIEIVPSKSATASNGLINDVNSILQTDGIDGLISKFNEPWEQQRFLANKGGAIDKGQNIVTVMENGAPVHMKVNDMDLLKALSNLNPQQATSITRAVGKVTGMMKTLTTGINPVFGLARNIWRDLASGYVNSKTINSNPLRYGQYMFDLVRAVGNTIAEPLGRAEFLPKTFQDLFKKGGEPMAYFKNIGGGGHVSSISSDANLLAKSKASILPKSNLKKVASIPQKLYGGLESLNNTLEVAPRLAEAKRVLKKGGTADQALYESQDLTTNFSRKGNIAKEIDAFIPYFNAAVQGLDKTVRVYNPLSSGGKNVANSVAKSVYAITIPTIVLYAINHKNEAYNMLSDYQKDNYYNIPRDDGTFTKIPKPREQGVVFGSLPERMLRAFKDNDPQAFNRFADTVVQNFKPPTTPIWQSGQDIWSTDQGRDWRDNPIVNQSMSNLSPSLQYDESTSEPAKFIGGKLNLSPKKLDATAKSYLGGVATLGIPATTKSKSVTDTLKQQFTVDPVYSNDIMNDFYNNLAKLQTAANDKDYLSGVTKKQDLASKTDEERKVTEMNKYKKFIDDLNKQIKASSDVTEKRNLRLQMLAIAKEANNTVK